VKNPSFTWNKDLQQFPGMKNNDLHQLFTFRRIPAL